MEDFLFADFSVQREFFDAGALLFAEIFLIDAKLIKSAAHAIAFLATDIAFRNSDQRKHRAFAGDDDL